MHGYLPDHGTRRPVKFQAHLHASGGLSQCQLCHRRFTRWQHLRTHIEDGSCEHLGGESMTKHPPRQPDAQVNILKEPAAAPSSEATGTSQNLLLLMREEFLSRLHNWEALLRMPRLRSDLQAHCTICHTWVADFRHVRQHITRIHEPEYPGLIQAALKHCATFKRQLTRDHDCPWCHRRFWSPDRHVVQCVVLLQVCVARGYHKRQVDAGIVERSESGGRRLQFLSSLLLSGTVTADNSPPQKEQPNKRPRHDVARSQPGASTKPKGRDRGRPSLSDDLRLLARLLIQHEDQLAALRVDKAFVLFARQDTYSIIPAMFAISQEWHRKWEETPDITQSPLRILLLACLIKELMQRIQKMVATQEGQDKLKAAHWMNQ